MNVVYLSLNKVRGAILLPTQNDKERTFKNIRNDLRGIEYSPSSPSQVLVNKIKNHSNDIYENHRIRPSVPNYPTLKTVVTHVLLILYNRKKKFVYTHGQLDNVHMIDNVKNFSVLHLLISLHLAKICKWHYRYSKAICTATLTPLGKQFVNHFLPNYKKTNVILNIMNIVDIIIPIILVIIFIICIIFGESSDFLLSMLCTAIAMATIAGFIIWVLYNLFDGLSNEQIKLLKSNSRKLTINNMDKFFKENHVEIPDGHFNKTHEQSNLLNDICDTTDSEIM